MLQAEDCVAVDVSIGLQGPARGRQVGQPVAQPLGPRHLFHAEVDGIAEPSAAGIVGAGGLGNHWRRCAEGIEHEQIGLQAGRPGGQPPQVGQVADAPAFRRPGGIELRDPAPLPPLRRQALARAHNHPRGPLPALREEIVVAQGQVGRQVAGKADCPALFQEQFAVLGPGGAGSGADHADRFLGRRRVRRLQGRQDRRGHVRRDVLPPVVGLVAMVIHAHETSPVAGRRCCGPNYTQRVPEKPTRCIGWELCVALRCRVGRAQRAPPAACHGCVSRAEATIQPFSGGARCARPTLLRLRNHKRITKPPAGTPDRGFAGSSGRSPGRGGRRRRQNRRRATGTDWR